MRLVNKLGVFFLLNFSILLAQNSHWKVFEMYVSAGKVAVLSAPEEGAKTKGFVYYRDKILIVRDQRLPLPFGWERIVFPQQGYVQTKSLISPKEKRALDVRFGNKPEEIPEWKTAIGICTNEFSFVKASPFNASETVGFLKEDDPVLILLANDMRQGLWLKTLYPYYGFVKRSAIALGGNERRLSIGIFYAPLSIPYEKNMENLKNPFGAFIIYDKASWLFSPGIGLTIGQSHLKTYILKTDFAYLFTNLNFLSIFNSHLEFFGTVAAGYWFGSFQNTKYPQLTKYFPLLKTSGFAYGAGGGFSINFSNFLLGAQYLFWNTPKTAVFGEEPKPGDFSNQYKLFPGSNQLNVFLGYRIKI
jgi:hypothetical protein